MKAIFDMMSGALTYVILTIIFWNQLNMFLQ